MEIKSSSFFAPVTQNVKTEPTKKTLEESEEIAPAKLADDVVILSSGGGAHPERPKKV